MTLSEILKKRNISKLQLALCTQITPSDLYSAMNGKKPFYPKWRKKIADYMQIDEKVLFEGM